jgi:hypothetical protein
VRAALRDLISEVTQHNVKTQSNLVNPNALLQKGIFKDGIVSKRKESKFHDISSWQTLGVPPTYLRGLFWSSMLCMVWSRGHGEIAYTAPPSSQAAEATQQIDS